MVSDGKTLPLDVAVVGESVAEVGPHGSLGPAKSVIDAEGHYVLPGVVDGHFHCRAPSHPERGTFATETMAAAAGGVTTVLEMPVSDPACSTPEVFEARRALGESQCYVDFGLFSGAALGSSGKADAMAGLGAIGFKLFTHDPPPGRDREFAGLWASSDDDIHTALSIVASTGLPCTVHAENQKLIDKFQNASSAEHQSPRPPVIESASIALLGALSRDSGARVHVAHMSSLAAVEALMAARTNSDLITGETAPHYLVFNEKDIDEYGSFVRVAPPLRSSEDNDALWDALNSGLIDIVASDHAPFTVSDKSVPYEDAPRGIPGIEMMLPVMMDAVSRGIIALEHSVRVITEHPARLFGLFPKKGAVSAGSDADLVIWDPGSDTVVELDSFLSRSGASAVAYNGKSYQGRLQRTILRGKTVFENGAIVGDSRGEFVRPIGSDA